MSDNQGTLILALLLIILGGIFGVMDSKADSPELDNLASTLTGLPTHVECFPSGGDTGGFVVLVSSGLNDSWHWQSDNTIYLGGDACGALQNVLTPGPRTAHWLRSFDGGSDVGSAMLKLVHEATHVRLLSTDEGLVECTAIRNVWQDMKQLPLSWKERQNAYRGALYTHNAIPTTGPYSEYRSVC